MQEMRHKDVDIRRLLELAAPHWVGLTLATLALFIGTGLTLLYPQAARIGIDQLVQAEDSHFTWETLGILLIVLFILQALFVGMRHYLYTIVGERIVRDLRKRLFDAIVVQEVGFFDSTKTGELTSRLTSDTQVLQNAVTINISIALRNLFQAVGSLIVLFMTSAKLAMVMVIAIPLGALLSVYYGGKVKRLSRLVQERLAESTSIAEESIAGIRTVRIFSAESLVSSFYDEAVDESYDAAWRRTVLGALFGGGITALGYGAIVVILWIGGEMVVSGELTAGELTAFLLYTFMAAFGLAGLGNLWTQLMRASGSAERVFYLIDRTPDLDVSLASQTKQIEGAVEFDNVCFSYPSRPEDKALRSVSFKVSPGQRVALVGPSGAGKSTIGALLLRFYDPQGGVVRLDGDALSTFEPKSLRDQMGVVSQDPILFSGTIRENLRFALPDATESDMLDALESANALDFVNGFRDGLETVIGERGVKLSGGQKQRIAIARAVLRNPRLLIFDEATSALDVESEAVVQRALERLMDGRTTIVIAHRLSTVAGSDLVLVMEEGRLVEVGDHASLVEKKGVYHRLIESQRLLT